MIQGPIQSELTCDFFCIYEDICILTMLTLKWCLRGWKTTVPSPVSNIYSNSQITEVLYCFFQTYIGDILVAVNPCKPLSLFDEKVGQKIEWFMMHKKRRKEKEHINKEALLGLHNACVMHCKLLVLAV